MFFQFLSILSSTPSKKNRSPICCPSLIHPLLNPRISNRAPTQTHTEEKEAQNEKALSCSFFRCSLFNRRGFRLRSKNGRSHGRRRSHVSNQRHRGQCRQFQGSHHACRSRQSSWPGGYTQVRGPIHRLCSNKRRLRKTSRRHR